MEPLSKTNPYLRTEEMRIEAVIQAVVSSSAAEGIIVDEADLRQSLANNSISVATDKDEA